MRDSDCIAFLQWALPRLQLRWAGFRKVRHQVCKRVNRRLGELRLATITEYQAYLQRQPEEWKKLTTLCQITISRFYRDRGVFLALEKTVLPALARKIRDCGENQLSVWSAGCGSGEEPYTLSIIWREALQPYFPDIALQLLATDIDPQLLRRAEKACYTFGSMKDLPEHWLETCFSRQEDNYCLLERYRQNIKFQQQDIRNVEPGTQFDLILCRNLAFTYFDYQSQLTVLKTLHNSLKDHGALVIGGHEKLPGDSPEFRLWPETCHIFCRN